MIRGLRDVPNFLRPSFLEIATRFPGPLVFIFFLRTIELPFSFVQGFLLQTKRLDLSNHLWGWGGIIRGGGWAKHFLESSVRDSIPFQLNV